MSIAWTRADRRLRQSPTSFRRRSTDQTSLRYGTSDDGDGDGGSEMSAIDLAGYIATSDPAPMPSSDGSASSSCDTSSSYSDSSCAAPDSSSY